MSESALQETSTALPASEGELIAREPTGQFKRGRSGNPGGKSIPEQQRMRQVRMMAGKYSEEALKTLVNIMRNRRVSHATRIVAANAILDRAVGRPPVPPSAVDSDGVDMSLVPEEGYVRARRIAFTLGKGLRVLEASRRAPAALGAMEEPE